MPFFNIELAINELPYILNGLPYTFGISLASFLIGLTLGFFVAQARLSRWRLLRWTATLFISFMRGTPMLVFLFLIYVGMPSVGYVIDPLTASLSAFSIMSSAYLAEVIRAAQLSVDTGQWEASRALGMTHWQTLRMIILPQAFRIAIPGMSNVLLDMVKSSSLTAMITVRDIFNLAKIAGGSADDYMTIYILVAFIYWCICSLYTLGQHALEKRISQAY